MVGFLRNQGNALLVQAIIFLIEALNARWRRYSNNSSVPIVTSNGVRCKASVPVGRAGPSAFAAMHHSVLGPVTQSATQPRYTASCVRVQPAPNTRGGIARLPTGHSMVDKYTQQGGAPFRSVMYNGRTTCSSRDTRHLGYIRPGASTDPRI